MTSDHIRRALILLFIFNAVLVAQNWAARDRIAGLEASFIEAVHNSGNSERAVQDFLTKQGDRINRIDEILSKLEEKTK